MVRLGTCERRTSDRLPARHPAVLRDSTGAVLLCARAINVSESGVFVVATAATDLDFPREAVLEMETRRGDGAPVLNVYRCRVVRCRRQGALVGVGLELVEKLV